MSTPAPEPTAAARRCALAIADLISSNRKTFTVGELVSVINATTHLPELIAVKDASNRLRDALMVYIAESTNKKLSSEVLVSYRQLAAALAAASIKPEGT